MSTTPNKPVSFPYPWSTDYWPSGLSWAGSGVQAAFEYGASTRMSGYQRSTSNIYTRADCVRAFDAGYETMDKFLREGGVIKCRCCGSRIAQ